MKKENLIAVNEFCIKHKIDTSFIDELQQTGLIEITFIEDNAFIEIAQIQQVEKFICFYYELDINLEGIETITHLLQQIESLQKEIISLKNRLSLYESSQ